MKSLTLATSKMFRDNYELLLRLDFLAVGHFALIDPQRKAAIRIRACPSFVRYRRSVLSVIRKRYEHSRVALLTGRKRNLPLHTSAPSAPHNSTPHSVTPQRHSATPLRNRNTTPQHCHSATLPLRPTATQSPEKKFCMLNLAGGVFPDDLLPTTERPPCKMRRSIKRFQRTESASCPFLKKYPTSYRFRGALREPQF